MDADANKADSAGTPLFVEQFKCANHIDLDNRENLPPLLPQIIPTISTFKHVYPNPTVERFNLEIDVCKPMQLRVTVKPLRMNRNSLSAYQQEMGATMLFVNDGVIANIYEDSLEKARTVTATWNGRNDRGQRSPSGFYRIEAHFNDSVSTRDVYWGIPFNNSSSLDSLQSLF